MCNICKFMDTNRGIIVVHGVGTGKTLTSVTVSQCYLDKNPKAENNPTKKQSVNFISLLVNIFHEK